MEAVGRTRWLAWIAVLLCVSGLGLGPNEIALVVNQDVPDSLRLAQAYAAARGIAEGRIIPLAVPGGNEIEFRQYESYVVPQVRAFLREHGLEKQIRCLVTFYGVPFRIRDREDTGEEKQELADLRQRLATTLRQGSDVLDHEEALALSLDAGFTPPPRAADASEVQHLARRYQMATRAIVMRLSATTQPSDRQRIGEELIRYMSVLGGRPDALQLTAPRHSTAASGATPQEQAWRKVADEVTAADRELFTQQQSRFDPDARAAVRRIAAEYFGVVRLGEVLESQIDYLTPGLTNAAFDSELALLWIPYYPRNGPWINPLHFGVNSSATSRTLMVSRLDGPDAATVQRMIETSVQVEKDGLRGCLAVNSYHFPRGVAANGVNEYEEYAMRFHDLARLVKAHGNIPVVEKYTGWFMDREVPDTALYAGWYSLRHYRPGMSFSAGAVGYHVASSEMLSLREPTEPGWVHGLLSDGVVATLGPVAEPYLVGFPPPDEFFPLLMTGKLTLAEVYWRTEPTASWMMCLIGDPLYTPYKTNPALKVEDLPATLRPALAGAATEPDSSPRRQ